MTGIEFQEAAMRTNDRKATVRLANRIVDKQATYDLGGALNGVLGLCGESGEVSDMIKKWLFHGHDLDVDHLEKEIGDVCWYIAMLCDAFGLNLDEVFLKNKMKLEHRYPEGFSEELSQHRAEGDV